MFANDAADSLLLSLSGECLVGTVVRTLHGSILRQLAVAERGDADSSGNQSSNDETILDTRACGGS